MRRSYDGTAHTRAAIANRLGVSEVAIKSRCAALGLARAPRVRWTSAEDDRLEELMDRYSVAHIGRLMGRSVNSIAVRAKRLGFSRSTHSGWYTLTEASAILGVDRRWCSSRIKSGELDATNHRSGGAPGGGATYHITEADLRAFIMDHVLELTGRNVDLFAIVHIVEGK